MKNEALSRLVGWGLFPLLAAAFGAAARADSFQHFWEPRGVAEGRFRLTPRASMYSTTANWDADAVASDLPNGGKYSSLGFDLGGAYGASKDFTLFANASWARWKSENATLEGTTYGLTDQTLGLSYVAGRFESGARIELQGQVDLPVYDNDKLRGDGNPDLGNQSLDGTAGGFALFPLSTDSSGGWWLTGGGGLMLRSKGYSKLGLWTVGLERETAEGFFAGLHGFGLMSLGGGASPWPAGEHFSGSFAVGAGEPSLVTVREKVGYRMRSGTALLASAHQALWGQNAPKGYAFAIGAEFRFGGDGGAETGEPARPGEGDADFRAKFVRYSGKTMKVTGVNDRLHLVRLDRGQSDGVQVGQVFDLFTTKPDGSAGDLVARGRITSVKPDESALEITEYYREIWIQEGFLAKQPLP